MENILNDIKSGNFSPVYFLHGEEPYFIDQIENAIEENALSEAERGFNQTILYGKDTEYLALADCLRRYPMMSERQVVILREAQEMKNLGELAAYVEKPMPTTVFVVCHKHKKYDMRTKMGKSLQNGKAVVVESKKLYDNQVPDWIIRYGKTKKLTIEAAAAALMTEYMGTDLSKISNEIDKLSLNVQPGASVTQSLVQEYIGISKEYNVFELQKALGVRDIHKVTLICNYFSFNMRKNPLIVTLSGLYSYFSKIYMLHFLRNQGDAEMLKALDLRSDWFLKEYKTALQHYSLEQTVQVLHLLHQYDLRAKGVENDGTSEAALMKELFWRILHA